ncbi:hypothetical protein ACTXT7_005492 [Hymenolepis weldensis]
MERRWLIGHLKEEYMRYEQHGFKEHTLERCLNPTFLFKINIHKTLSLNDYRSRQHGYIPTVTVFKNPNMRRLNVQERARQSERYEVRKQIARVQTRWLSTAKHHYQ